MKKTLVLGMALALAAPSFANKGAQNGQPFLYLQTQISENRALIEENQDAINALEFDLAALTQQVSDIDAALTDLSEDVANNTADIANAVVRIETAEGNIEALSAELMALAAQHNADVAAIAAAIAGLQADLAALAQSAAAVAAELDAKIAAVRASVDENSIAIDTLLLDIALLNAELSSINANYNNLSSQVSSLEAQLASYAGDLAAFENALNDLNSRVTTLEGFHIVDAVCGEADELCKDLPWVYIDEENGLAWAWASPCSGGCSQIDLAGRTGNLTGWRFASEEEWATRPPKTVFGGAGFRYGATGSVECAAPIFDNRWNHCDYSNPEVRLPNNGYYEQWIVHDLYETP